VDDLVSVIILNWNGREYIRACLDSVYRQDYGNLEIIVVDNASEDGSAELVKRDYPGVVLMENAANLGFGGGNNTGIRRATGGYILILNNDAEMDKGCISALKRALEKDPRYGASESKILFKESPERMDAAGIAVFPDGLSIGRGRHEPAALYEREEEVFFSSGCCALYRREMLEDIKVFDEYYDEDFFAYADDTDLGWRARIRGWRCIFTPEARTYHMHSASYGRYSPFKAYLVERNRIWVQVKNFPLSAILYGLPFTAARYVLQAYGAFTGRGASGEFSKEYAKGELIKVLWRAYASAFKGLPRMMGKRREIRKRRMVSRKDLFGLLKAHGIGTRSIAFKK
jgi:GT2 family glycosyltransferase